LEDLLKQKAAVETAGNVNMYKTQDFPKALKLVFGYLEHPLNHWKSPEFIEQRTLLNVYFNKGISYNKISGFGTPKLPLILEVLTQSNPSKNHMVDSMENGLNQIWDYIWRWYPWVKDLETANVAG